mgnify:CR=1 FL=1
MAGYIGSKSSVTQVDGYTEAEADAEFVNDPNGAITVSGSNVGIGTSSPSADLEVVSGTTATTIKVKGTAADGYRHGYELENLHTGGTTYSMFTTNSSDGVLVEVSLL